MGGERVISFEVCANGDLKVKAPKGQRLVVDQSSPHEIRISGAQLIGQTAAISRSAAFSAAVNIGDVMDDGSIYAGISPATGQHFFTVSSEHMRRLEPKPQIAYVSQGRFHGHRDWQLSTSDEIDHIVENRFRGELDSLLGKKGGRGIRQFVVRTNTDIPFRV